VNYYFDLRQWGHVSVTFVSLILCIAIAVWFLVQQKKSWGYTV